MISIDVPMLRSSRWVEGWREATRSPPKIGRQAVPTPSWRPIFIAKDGILYVVFRYESGHVELMEGAEGVLGLRSPVPQMDADLFLDVAWRRMKLLPAIIDDLRQAARLHSGKNQNTENLVPFASR